MALATCCPHCHTTFRVVHDQLKLRSGMVRCGHCEQVFNGIEHLIRANSNLAAPEPPVAPVSVIASLIEEAPVTAPMPIHEPIPKPIHEPIPKPIPEPIPEPIHEPIHEPIPEPIHAPAPAETITFPPHPEPSVESIRVEQLAFPPETPVGGKVEPSFDEPPPSPKSQAHPPAAILQDNKPEKIPERWVDDTDNDEPDFVKTGRRQEKFQRVWFVLQSFACLLLFIGLLAQVAFTWRDLIAVRWPNSKPWLLQGCALLQCKVELPTQINLISIEMGELQALPDTRNHFSYITLLRNQGKWLQSWPHIELVLLDNDERIIARRVFSANDYLSTAAERNNGFAARSEQIVKLNFEIRQLKAAGYRAEVFYP